MANAKLATIGNVSMSGVKRTGAIANNTRAGSHGVVAMFNRVDGWAQRYFSALAVARNRKELSCHCEW